MHSTEQIPNPRTRVQSLLDSIEGCTDPKVCTRVAAISNETNNMLDDFEAAVAHLIPVCPVASKFGNKPKNVCISGVGGNIKSGTGPKTGVEIHFYTSNEYRKLSADERKEPKELRPSSGKGKGKGKGKGRGTPGKPGSDKNPTSVKG